jgi:hypothetical protein
MKEVRPAGMQSDDDDDERSTSPTQAVSPQSVNNRPSYGFTAVLAILLVAFTNPSLTGMLQAQLL